MPRLLFAPLFALLALVILAPSVGAQDRADLRRVVLVNGDVYVGTVEDETADPVVVVTTDGVRREFSRAQVSLVAPLIRGRFFRTDPVKTRLFFAPTARTLGGGEFRGDLTYFYPSITAGVSQRVDFLASGFVTVGSDAFVTPLVGLKAQVYTGESAQIALGTSALFAFSDGGDDFVVVVPYGVATFGDETRSVSVGAGGLLGGDIGDGEFNTADLVVLGLGAETQINNGVKLFVEALAGVGTGDESDSGLLILPGVRFFGNRFAFDLIGFLATDFDTLIGFAPVGARVGYTF